MTLATDQITAPHPSGTLRALMRRVGRWFGLTPPAAVVPAGLDVAEVAAVLDELHTATTLAAPLNRQIKQAKARLADLAAAAGLDEVPEGMYGELLLSRGKPSERFDQRAARTTLEDHGLPVPMAPVRGALRVERLG